MLVFNDLGLHYGERVLFQNVNCVLNKNRRYGITGANGAGKSTLLKLVSGHEQPSEGNIEMPKSALVGFLQQDHFRYEQQRIVDVVLQGKPKLWDALQEKEKILQHETISEEDGIKLAELEMVICEQDGYSAESFAQVILLGLGLPQEKHQQKMSSLSGGFKLRVLMAQTLFKQPQILLLDEPTNHLDIVATHWLEGFLKKDFQGVLLVVSHDHTFLNRVSTDILDVDYQEVRHYKGNYEQSLKAKVLDQEQREIEFKEKTRQIAHLQSYVDRFRAKATKARQAQSRVKRIEKIELPEIVESSRRAPNFRFETKRPSGKVVVKANKITKAFGELQVLNNVSFQIERGEKVAIIGPNGIGKSTLLKILLSKIEPDQGSFEWGYESHVSYFAQDHHEVLKDDQSLFAWLQNKATQTEEKVLRSVLASMLFTQDDVKKSCKSLSGGEAARLLFGSIQLEKGNVLVLDEPTNHLDLETIEALAENLKNYAGTLIVVSHDRHFINLCCDRVLAISKNEVADYRAQDAQDLDLILDMQFAI